MLIIALILTLIFTFLLALKPRSLFLLILAALILFNGPILGDVIIFTIGGAKVYPGDVLLASITAFLIWRTLQKGFPLLPVSGSFFSLFFAWGMIAIVRGIPQYGYSAVGEARWYILPMLYYYYILVVFKDKQHIQIIAKWFTWSTLVMILFSFIDFYFLGGKERVAPQLWGDPRQIFRFIRATEGLLAALVLIGLLSFYIFGEVRKRLVILYVIFGVLLITIIMIQTRVVWLATIVGASVLGAQITFRLLKKRLPRRSIALLIIGSTTLLISAFILIPSRASSIIYTTIAKELVFFQNPSEDPTGSWRLRGWRQELEKAVQNPILGQGLGGYSEWFDGINWQRVAVHNDYIMYFSKFGFMGLLLLFSGILFWYYEMERYTRVEENRYYKLLSRVIQIGVLMHMAFAFFYYFTIFFWMLLAVGTALSRTNVLSKSVPQLDETNLTAEVR